MQFSSFIMPIACCHLISESIETIEGGTKRSNGGFVLPLESTTSSWFGNTKAEASTQVNGIKSPSSVVLCSGMGNASNGRASPEISKECVNVDDASSEFQESIQQSYGQNITKGDMFKAISPASCISSSMELHFERSSQSQVTPEDSMTAEDNTEDQRYNKHCPENVSSVSNIGVMEEKKKMDERRKGQEQFTVSNEILENELINNISDDDDSTRKGKLNSATLQLSKKSHKDPTSILMNDKAEDARNVKFPLQSTESYGQFIRSQTLDQAEEINTSNGVHVGAACHEDINVNGSILNDNAELKAEVEMLQEELREAAALEASMYSVIAEHGSSNKVHAPARRLSRFYFHACRVGSPAKIASAAQSAVSGFVLVSKACGHDVPRYKKVDFITFSTMLK